VKCDRVRELVSDALDGILGEGVAEAYRAHLDGCPPCRVFHDEMQQSLGLLNELPTVEVGPDFDEAVWRRLRAQETPRSLRELLRLRFAHYRSRLDTLSGVGRWAPVAVAAAVLMAVAIVPTGQDPSLATREAATDGPEVAARLVSAPEPAADPVVESDEIERLEVYAGMPEAVEAYLQNALDLRLQADPDLYRRSNYSYPLRHVRTPRPGQSVGTQAVPVHAISTEPEVRVVSF